MVTHKVVPANNEKIDKWLGVNENPDGDIGIAKGEFSTSTNVKITNDYAAVKRPGTQNVANLLFAYSIDTAATTTDVLEEVITTTATFAVYPTVDVTDGGILALSGASATMNYANHNTYVDDYYQDANGLVWKFADCVYDDGIAESVQQYRWNKYSCTVSSATVYAPSSFAFQIASVRGGAISGYSSYSFNVNTGVYTLTGTLTSIPILSTGTVYQGGGSSVYRVDVTEDASAAYLSTALGPFVETVYAKGLTSYGYVYGATAAYPTNGQQIDSGTYYWYDSKVQNATYTWKFYAVTVVADSGDSPVQGLWSGRVGSDEFMVAACDGRLWALTETNGVWTKDNIGAVDTTNKVHFFGFDEKLYIQNGVAYMSWDATTHTEHTYTCLGSESGNYYITVDTINYRFSLTTPTAGHLLVFNEYDLSLKLNGTPVSYTTGATSGTNLTSGLVASTVYNPPVAVVGYCPILYTGIVPTGIDSDDVYFERVNMLNGLRRMRFSPNGSATVYYLPDTGIASVDYVKNLTTGALYTIIAPPTSPASATECTYNLTNGTITFHTAPVSGTNTLEIKWTYGTTLRSQIEAMTLSEMYNGATDNRVFVYGDGSNKTFYSGLDENGQETAEYFPDFNVCHAGEANTAITSMMRHDNLLIAFKEDSAYIVKYDILELVSGTTTASFYLTPMHRSLGCAGYGQAQMVVNHPRTLDGRSILEWSTTSNSTDQRIAQDISQKVYNTIREMDLATAVTFYDKVNQEYYIVQNGIAIVQNTYNKTWYVYRDFPALCMIVYQDELYFGTADGYIRHVSREYFHDVGAEIDVWGETGSMDFGLPHIRKNSKEIFIVLKPEANASINVTVQTDVQDDYTDTEVLEDYSGTVDAGIFDFANLHFGHFTFNVNDKPQTQRKKIKVKKFVWYKLIFHSASNDTTFTLLNSLIKYTNVSEVK